MSSFVDSVLAAAANSSNGMTTDEPHAPMRRSWAEVHAAARRAAAGLLAEGMQPGDRVSVLAGEPAHIAPAVQAVWLAGGSVTMLHQPTPRADLTLWQADTVRALKMIDSSLVLLGPPFEALTDVLRESGIACRMITDLDVGLGDDFTHVWVDEESAALLQLTSGSTAEPKAVRITHGNLYANITTAAAALKLEQGSTVMVSWLPMYHDMGMVGGLLTPMAMGFELVSVTPTYFVSSPGLWPELLSKYGGTVTMAPNFAYAVMTRHLVRAKEQSLDLSSLRIALNGGEPIDVDTMAAFVSAGARFGMRSECATCCYGAAESTVAISLAPIDQPMVVDVIDTGELEKNHRAVPFAGADPTGGRRLPLLGPPLPGIEVRVVGESGEVLGEREVSVLQLRGTSITSGYLTVDGLQAAQDADGWLDIGDEGYLTDGQIVVCGRRKDVIIMGGRNIYPTDIERVVGRLDGVRAGNVITVRITDNSLSGLGRESFAVIVESHQAGDAAAEEAIRDAITARVGAEIGARPAVVRILRPGSLPKTPSGKLRRTAARDLL